MSDRKKFKWNVFLADEQGVTHETSLESYWDPEKDFITPELIAETACAELGKTSLKPVSAALAVA